MWALCLSNESGVLRLAEFPEDDLGYPHLLSESDRHQEIYRQYYIEVARFIRNSGERIPNASVPGRKPAKRSKPKLLLSALDCLRQRDDVGLRKAVQAHLELHVKHSFPKGGLEDKLALDATILDHLARSRGIELGDLGGFSDYLVRLPKTETK